MIVRFLSLSEERVLLAITAGTEQPNPSSIGTKLLPERPILRRNVSITKAILAIYPVSSNIDKKKNRIRITGRKLSTLPTPVNIPSITIIFKSHLSDEEYKKLYGQPDNIYLNTLLPEYRKQVLKLVEKSNRQKREMLIKEQTMKKKNYK